MKDEIEKRFGLVWPYHVSNLTQLLIAARHNFDGDLDMFIVLAVIGDRTFSAGRADPEQSYANWQAEGTRRLAPDDINVRSIADFTGIPRETVRRKLLILEEKGWIARQGNNIRATAQAREDLAPLTRSSIRYLDQLFRLFSKLTMPSAA